MATALRPVGYEDRLSIVEHLTELRTRLMICLAAFFVAFGVCFWQNDRVLDIVNKPLEDTAFKKGEKSQDPFERAQSFNEVQRSVFAERAKILADLSARADADERALYERLAALDRRLLDAAPRASARKPITTGVGEPFVVTFKLAAYAALLIAMPLILYQLYAFILPALSPRERGVAIPLMSMIPVLFICGVVFAYLVVLPKGIDFLQNFNDESFDILLQAKDYVRFAVLVLMAMGILFQIPVVILALTRLEILTVAQLRANRRYAILVIAVMAMLLPGTDPITMLVAMAPLFVLFEGSILLAALLDRRSRRLEAVEAERLALSVQDADEEDEQHRPSSPPD